MRFDWRKFLQTVVPAAIAGLLAALGIPVVTQVSGCGKGPSTVPTCPAPPDPPKPIADPVKAIGKLSMRNGFCSATVVGPPNGSGRWTLVTAAHCVKAGLGERVSFRSRSGQEFGCTVQAVSRESDIAILASDVVSGDLPWIAVAERTPEPGTEVLHAGYGVHIPGNVERGTVVGPAGNGQVQFMLSVSNGDSGGGICSVVTGQLVSPVCCTSSLAARGRVFGGSPERIRQMIANAGWPASVDPDYPPESFVPVAVPVSP